MRDASAAGAVCDRPLAAGSVVLHPSPAVVKQHDPPRGLISVINSCDRNDIRAWIREGAKDN